MVSNAVLQAHCVRMFCTHWHWQQSGRQSRVQGENKRNTVHSVIHDVHNYETCNIQRGVNYLLLQVAEIIDVLETGKVYQLGTIRTNKGLRLRSVLNTVR